MTDDLSPGMREMSPEERAYECSLWDEVAPGVYGEVVVRGHVTFINVLVAQQEGSGAVGRYLDSLADRIVIVPNVLSPRLKGMLMRRGYVHSYVSGWWSRNLEGL